MIQKFVDKDTAGELVLEDADETEAKDIDDLDEELVEDVKATPEEDLVDVETLEVVVDELKDTPEVVVVVSRPLVLKVVVVAILLGDIRLDDILIEGEEFPDDNLLVLDLLDEIDKGDILLDEVLLNDVLAEEDFLNEAVVDECLVEEDFVELLFKDFLLDVV